MHKVTTTHVTKTFTACKGELMSSISMTTNLWDFPYLETVNTTIFKCSKM